MRENTKKVTMTVLKIASNVVFALVLLLALVVLFVNLGSKSDGTPSKVFGYSPMTVQSSSMDGDKETSFKKGTLIFIDRNDTSYDIGDVITFYTTINGKEELNTHRIVDIHLSTDSLIETTYQTQGDNIVTNPNPDDVWVEESEIIGVYHGAHINGVGSAIDFLQTSLGFFLLIVLPMFAYFVYHVVRVVLVAGEYKREKNGAVIDVTPVSEEAEEEKEEETTKPLEEEVPTEEVVEESAEEKVEPKPVAKKTTKKKEATKE